MQPSPPSNFLIVLHEKAMQDLSRNCAQSAKSQLGSRHSSCAVSGCFTALIM